MPQANQRCILDRLFMFTGRRFRLLIKYSADVHCTIIYIYIYIYTVQLYIFLFFTPKQSFMLHIIIITIIITNYYYYYYYYYGLGSKNPKG